jgi:VanZ family protein
MSARRSPGPGILGRDAADPAARREVLERRRSGLFVLLVVLAAASIAAHLFGLYRSTGPPSPSWFPLADKAEHLVGFGAPVALVLLARSCRRDWRPPPRGSREVLLVVAVFALHGVVSELLQHFFYANRTGDPFDVLADWSGVALGWWLARLVEAKAFRRRHTAPSDAATLR